MKQIISEYLMSNGTQVATQTSVATKIAVATLLLAGLAALGYASGYLRLDYQSSQAVSDAAAEQCDCLWQCAETRKACIASGRPVDECNGDLGACVDSCEPKDSSKDQPNGDQPGGSAVMLDECSEQCKDTYDSCLKAGRSEKECLDEAAACRCECDPNFAPVGYDNSCVDQCQADRDSCEATNAADPSLNLDCQGRQQGCLNECDLWCDGDRNGSGTNQPNGDQPKGSSTQADECTSSCDADYTQCEADKATNPSLDCEGRREGCLRECDDDNGGSSTPPKDDDSKDDQPNGDQPNGSGTDQPNGDQPGTTNANDGSVNAGTNDVNAGGGASVGGDL